MDRWRSIETSAVPRVWRSEREPDTERATRSRADVPFDLDRALDVARDRAVIAFLRRAQPSAHDDVASELEIAARGLSGVRRYCPDPAAYAYFLLHDRTPTVFAIAYGMSALAFRLSEEHALEAREDGGVPCDEIGEGWVRFEPYRASETLAASRARLAKWCRIALADAGDAGKRRDA